MDAGFQHLAHGDLGHWEIHWHGTRAGSMCAAPGLGLARGGWPPRRRCVRTPAEHPGAGVVDGCGFDGTPVVAAIKPLKVDAGGTGVKSSGAGTPATGHGPGGHGWTRPREIGREWLDRAAGHAPWPVSRDIGDNPPMINLKPRRPREDAGWPAAWPPKSWIVAPFVKLGVTTEELDRICHDHIVNVQGAIPVPTSATGASLSHRVHLGQQRHLPRHPERRQGPPGTATSSTSTSP